MSLAFFVFFCVAALLGIYAVAVEPFFRPRIRHYTIAPTSWPKGLPLRIAVVADSHASAPHMTTKRLERIVSDVNALDTDIIVLLGDYVADHRLQWRCYEPEEWAVPLAALKAPLGVHAILGNHDWWGDEDAQSRRGGPTRAGRALEDVGIRVYENTARKIETRHGDFWLAGLGDQIALVDQRSKRPFGACSLTGVDDLEATLSQVSGDEPTILLAHEPDVFATVPSRVSVTLSGHTHGGQVNLFGWTPVVPSRFGSRYVYGHVVEDDKHLVVSGGLGCSSLPIRFGVPPEILVVEIG